MKRVSKTTILLIAFFATLLSISSLAQTQLGADIDGEAAGDIAVHVSLSDDGNRLAVGADSNNGNGRAAGHVRVFQWSGEAWTQLGADIDGEHELDQTRASSLSADGSRVAVGASQASGFHPPDSGQVRVFQWSGEAWTQLGASIFGEAHDDESGDSISLSDDGNRLAIGAPGNTNGNGLESGHVRVYEWSGMEWTQLGLDIDGEATNDHAGRAVLFSADGSRLAIGASNQVRVFQWSGEAWTQLGASIIGEKPSDSYGSHGRVSFSADGYMLAIAATDVDIIGSVRFYQWSGTSWVKVRTEISGEAVGDVANAVSLSADGNRVAIGAANHDGNGIDSGRVRLYQWSANTWTQIGTDIYGESAGDAFGATLGLSAVGDRLAAGAPLNGGNGESAGHVRVYSFFQINPGLNDAWYFPDTSGQGFFITVFPDLGYVSLAWFTYDTELPPINATANLGDPGHRWITAVGPISGNQALMDIEMTSGGIFDTPSVITRTDPPGSDGTILLTFDSCNSGTVEYDIPSINRKGVVPIQRVANDNIALCEALDAD